MSCPPALNSSTALALSIIPVADSRSFEYVSKRLGFHVCVRELYVIAPRRFWPRITMGQKGIIVITRFPSCRDFPQIEKSYFTAKPLTHDDPVPGKNLHASVSGDPIGVAQLSTLYWPVSLT